MGKLVVCGRRGAAGDDGGVGDRGRHRRCLGLRSGDSGSGGSDRGGRRVRRAPAAGQAAIPPDWLTLYQQAAATCPGLSWSVVAAIGTVETGSGQSTRTGGVVGANSAGAEGPMQFEPATFAAYATVGPGGARPPSPYDPVDAVYSAATLLCADGAGSAATLRAAVDDYNHSGSLRGHRAHPVPLLPAGPDHPRHGGGRPLVRRPAAGHPLPVGRHRRRVASTARGWSRPPSPTPVSCSPGWPRTSSTPGRWSPPDHRWNPGTWSSSAAAPPASTTSGSTWARAR